jgi:hypothetical protein
MEDMKKVFPHKVAFVYLGLICWCYSFFFFHFVFTSSCFYSVSLRVCLLRTHIIAIIVLSRFIALHLSLSLSRSLIHSMSK